MAHTKDEPAHKEETHKEPDVESGEEPPSGFSKSRGLILAIVGIIIITIIFIYMFQEGVFPF